MSLSAVLLAGGESTRMGRDKATLEWRGLPLWAYQLQKLRALTSNIFVSARFAVRWRPADVKLVIDESPSRGPLSGLTASLGITETDCLLVLAVDMPFMTVSRHGCNLPRCAERKAPPKETRLLAKLPSYLGVRFS